MPAGSRPRATATQRGQMQIAATGPAGVMARAQSSAVVASSSASPRAVRSSKATARRAVATASGTGQLRQGVADQAVQVDGGARGIGHHLVVAEVGVIQALR